MGQSAQTNNWTTLDEIFYVRSLFLVGKPRLLARYILIAQNRNWTGPGMAVDAHSVILTAMDYLDQLSITPVVRGPKGIQ